MMTTALKLDLNIDRPDDFYEDLINAHRDLGEAESLRFNARLILILANHIGDRDVLAAALRLATDTGPQAARSRG